jgi:purine-nucleoside phosphorylase
MPGDPLRAERIASAFLEGARRFNSVRGMLGYTGTYRGQPVSVMGSGMGIPSMGIYSYELYKEFGVERIVRVGTCGGYREDMELGDLVLAQASSTTSSWAEQYGLGGSFSAVPDYGMLESAAAAARGGGRPGVVGHTHGRGQIAAAHKVPKVWTPWVEMGIVATDMEAYSLYCNAASLGKRALAMFSVSDLRLKGLHMSAEERERAQGSMVEVALESLFTR